MTASHPVIDPAVVARARSYTVLSGVGAPAAPGVAGLSVVVSEHPTPLTADRYDPVVCLILQGAKVVELGARRVRCAAGQSIIVSHDLPLLAQTVEASPADPYVAVVIDLDLDVLHDLASPDTIPPNDIAELALQVGTTDDATIDAVRRLLEVVRHPDEAAVVAPLIRRELHYRVLRAAHGGMVRALLRRQSRAGRVAEAIARIRDDIARSIAVPDLAASVGMSSSSFHEHFRAVTGTTPLQYQKDLRLLEARRLLRDEDRSVTGAAFAVGYRSPTQFSREYARRFGAPPSGDRTAHRRTPST